ncbi:MAG: alpha/beta fold hydrolase [Deltaproteobacteria bacterium]|nr:alpha/beta fold hydrolase [Deltaproteobacteria bacterium]
MPYVIKDGIRIHYQVGGGGAPLVLQHGFTRDMETLKMLGYPGYFENGYQVILIDARGHGSSDKPHSPAAYGLEKSVGDVVAVLDELDVARSHYMGYSMSGVVGFAMAEHAPERLRSLVIGGAHPYADDLASFQNVDGRDPEAFVAAVEALIGEKIAPEMLPMLFENDLEALSAAARPRPNMEAVLPKINVPCLLFAGTADARHDRVEACAKKIPNGKFLSFPDLNHVSCFLRADLILPRIREFFDGLEEQG